MQKVRSGIGGKKDKVSENGRRYNLETHLGERTSSSSSTNFHILDLCDNSIEKRLGMKCPLPPPNQTYFLMGVSNFVFLHLDKRNKLEKSVRKNNS